MEREFLVTFSLRGISPKHFHSVSEDPKEGGGTQSDCEIATLPGNSDEGQRHPGRAHSLSADGAYHAGPMAREAGVRSRWKRIPRQSEVVEKAWKYCSTRSRGRKVEKVSTVSS